MSDQEKINELMKELERKKLASTPMSREDASRKAKLLSDAYSKITNGAENKLKAGKLAQWKKGLKNKRMPRYGEPAIVLEILAEPVIDEENGGGSSYFREPLNLILGFIDEDDGDFVIFHYDKRRFEPFQD